MMSTNMNSSVRGIDTGAAAAPSLWSPRLAAPSAFKASLSTARAVRKANKEHRRSDAEIAQDLATYVFPPRPSSSSSSSSGSSSSLKPLLLRSYPSITSPALLEGLEHRQSERVVSGSRPSRSRPSTSYFTSLAASYRAHRASIIPALTILVLFATLALLTASMLPLHAVAHRSASGSVLVAGRRGGLNASSSSPTVIDTNAYGWRAARGRSLFTGDVNDEVISEADARSESESESVVYPRDVIDEYTHEIVPPEFEENDKRAPSSSSSVGVVASPSGVMSAKFRAPSARAGVVVRRWKKLEVYGVGIVRVPAEEGDAALAVGEEAPAPVAAPAGSEKRSDSGYEHGEDLGKLFGSRIARPTGTGIGGRRSYLFRTS